MGEKLSKLNPSSAEAGEQLSRFDFSLSDPLIKEESKNFIKFKEMINEFKANPVPSKL